MTVDGWAVMDGVIHALELKTACLLLPFQEKYYIVSYIRADILNVEAVKRDFAAFEVSQFFHTERRAFAYAKRALKNGDCFLDHVEITVEVRRIRYDGQVEIRSEDSFDLVAGCVVPWKRDRYHRTTLTQERPQLRLSE